MSRVVENIYKYFLSKEFTVIKLVFMSYNIGRFSIV